VNALRGERGHEEMLAIAQRAAAIRKEHIRQIRHV
jgi:hypothetical protein